MNLNPDYLHSIIEKATLEPIPDHVLEQFVPEEYHKLVRYLELNVPESVPLPSHLNIEWERWNTSSFAFKVFNTFLLASLSYNLWTKYLPEASLNPLDAVETPVGIPKTNSCFDWFGLSFSLIFHLVNQLFLVLWFHLEVFPSFESKFHLCICILNITCARIFSE